MDELNRALRLVRFLQNTEGSHLFANPTKQNPNFYSRRPMPSETRAYGVVALYEEYMPSFFTVGFVHESHLDDDGAPGHVYNASGDLVHGVKLRVPEETRRRVHSFFELVFKNIKRKILVFWCI